MFGSDTFASIGFAEFSSGGSISLSAESGAFTLTGLPIGFIATNAVSPGAFALAGISTAFTVTMAANAGSYLLTGNAVTLRPLIINAPLYLRGNSARRSSFWRGRS